MIAEIAHGLAWLACACAGLLIFAAWRLPDLMVPAALALGWLWLWIVGGVLWLFGSLDLSVAAVAANTHSHLPEGLRLAAAVLRPGGGWPVAAAVAAWTGAGLALVRPGWRGALSGVGALALGLALIVVTGGQTFARLAPAPSEGTGFDPAWRDGIASFGVSGTTTVDTVLAVGGRAGTTTLAAVTPVAGEDSTGVLAEIRVGGDDPLVLTPEWRETFLPRHASGVPDTIWSDFGWWRASLGSPRRDGRWPVVVARIEAWPGLLVAASLAAIGLAGALRRRRTR